MRDNLLTLISKEKNVNSVIILTHNIDFIFIQTLVLKDLKKIGNPSLTIFADAQCVQESYENKKLFISKHLGKRYRVVPVSLKSAFDRFHPKAVLLSSKDKASLFIGSGNLTFGGWHSNAEIWNHYDSTLDGTSIFNAFKNYLDELVNRLPYTNNIRIAVNHAYDQETTLWARDMEAATGLISRISTKSSLLEQMQFHAPKGCEELIIQSPYFDKRGKTIHQLNQLFTPKEIKVFAQNHHSDLTQEIINTFEKHMRVIPTSWNNTSTQAFIHAKFYAFVYQKNVVVFSGSANCSQAALAMNDPFSGNAELMSVSIMSVSEFNKKYINELEIDATIKFKPKTQKDVEESYSDRIIEKAVQIHAVQFEYNQITISYKLDKKYEIVGCKIYEIIESKIEENQYEVKFINNSLLYIDQLKNEPERLCLLLRDIDSKELICSNEIWIDYECDLSKSSKTRNLGDFIQKHSDLSSSYSILGELIQVFYEHIIHTPKRTEFHALNTTKEKHDNNVIFNPKNVFIDDYNFSPLHTISSNHRNFNIQTLLCQCLGLYNNVNEELQNAQIQEELKEQLEKDDIEIKESTPKKLPINPPDIDDNNRKKIKKLFETLVSKFIDDKILENKSLRILLNDLKVVSIILRLGLDRTWLSQEEYFDTTYSIWTKIFFPDEQSYNESYIDRKLVQENVFIENFSSADLSATMLTWLFAVQPSNNIKYIRLLLSAILIHAKHKWIFLGAEKKAINVEVYKSLIAINPQKIDHTLIAHGELWKLILKTGDAFTELLEKLSHDKITTYKDKLPMREIAKGELLWEGDANFFIVKAKYLRKKNPKSWDQAKVISVNQRKVETSYMVDYTIPVQDLLNLEHEFITKDAKATLESFINSYLLDKIHLQSLA